MDKNRLSNAPESVQDKYYNGQCMFLAAALNRKYGFEIQACINTQDEDSWAHWIEHAWVLIDNQPFDIYGFHDSIPWASDSKTSIIQSNLDENSLFEYYGNRFSSQEAMIEYERLIRDALKTSDLYLKSIIEVNQPIQHHARRKLK